MYIFSHLIKFYLHVLFWFCLILLVCLYSSWHWLWLHPLPLFLPVLFLLPWTECQAFHLVSAVHWCEYSIVLSLSAFMKSKTILFTVLHFCIAHTYTAVLMPSTFSFIWSFRLKSWSISNLDLQFTSCSSIIIFFHVFFISNIHFIKCNFIIFYHIQFFALIWHGTKKLGLDLESMP